MQSVNQNPKPLWRLRSSERRSLLIFVDLLVSAFSLLIALYFWATQDAWLNFSWEFLRTRPPFWFYLLPLIWLIFMIELYDVRRASRRSDTLRGIAIALGVCAFLYLFVYFSSAPNSLPRRGVAAFLVSTAVITLIWRLIYIRIFTAPAFLRRVLIVGAGRAGSALAEVISKTNPLPYHVAGFIDDDFEKHNTDIEGFPVLAGSNDLLKIVQSEGISDLVFAISGDMNPIMFQALLDAEEAGIEVTTVINAYEELTGRVPIFLLQSDWVLRSFVDQAHASDFYEMGKRLMDLAGAIVGLILFLGLFPFLAFAIIIDDRFPVLFSQTRLGKYGQVYKITKFRSMRRDAEKDGLARMAIENDERVTRLGRFLRKSHLDELPQFINVLRGEMSLVGPRSERPELVDELQRRIPFYRARLFVKPGLTGWAQINQRYASNIEETGIKLQYDLYYIKNRNLLMDFYILLRTVGQVVGLKGQ